MSPVSILGGGEVIQVHATRRSTIIRAGSDELLLRKDGKLTEEELGRSIPDTFICSVDDPALVDMVALREVSGYSKDTRSLIRYTQSVENLEQTVWVYPDSVEMRTTKKQNERYVTHQLEMELRDGRPVRDSKLESVSIDHHGQLPKIRVGDLDYHLGNTVTVSRI